MRNFRVWAVVAAISAGLVTGCSVPVQGTAAPAGSSGSLINESSTPLPTAAPVLDTQLSFGETMAWESGVKASISQPEKTTISSYHRKAGQKAVKATVTVTNGTSEALPASFISLNATVNGTPADQVFDSANGMLGAPSNDILPGKSIEYAVAWNVPNAGGEFQIDMRPTFVSQTCYFVGQV